MKRNLILACCAMSLLFISEGCSNDDNADQISLVDLEILYDEIVALSESVPCEDASEWTFTPIGNKACGGPSSYIAYSTTIDIDNFLAKVEAYTMAEKEYNQENGIISDCSLVLEPADVVCQDGKASFVYSFD